MNLIDVNDVEKRNLDDDVRDIQQHRHTEFYIQHYTLPLRGKAYSGQKSIILELESLNIRWVEAIVTRWY